ncbi:hypothetical protein MY11210_004257 [Beauveria gryllotalpidicola]
MPRIPPKSIRLLIGLLPTDVVIISGKGSTILAAYPYQTFE